MAAVAAEVVLVEAVASAVEDPAAVLAEARDPVALVDPGPVALVDPGPVVFTEDLLLADIITVGVCPWADGSVVGATAAEEDALAA